MMWLTKIPALFAGNGLIVSMLAAGGVMFFTWRHDIKESGRQGVRVEIEKANDKASKIGTSAARKSTASGVQMGNIRRQRDPSTRDD